MSTLKVSEILDTAGGNTVTINGATPTQYNTMGRNRIINGDMRIDQRNAGAAVTASASYPVDRFIIINSTDGAFSAQQDSSAPSGFVNSLKVTTTTADASLTTTQNMRLEQRVEGVNVSDLAWGTASAKTVTLSFWVRSSLTGTFGGVLRNSANDRSYPFSYSISSADTWEQKSITVSGDTTGTWLTTTGIGLRVGFGLGVGPDLSGTANAWAATQYMAPTGAVSVIGTLNATFYITGVQLEVGSVATEFERRPYGTELALCQRYYQAIGPIKYFALNRWFYDAGVGIGWLQWQVPMRAAPTVTDNGGWDSGSGYASSMAYGGNTYGTSINNNDFALSANASAFINNGTIKASAEL